MSKFTPASQIAQLIRAIFATRNQFDILPNKINDARLKRLKDCHKNRRAVVSGNGPSLQTKDLDLLKNEITFASNKVFQPFESTDWRSTYLTVSDAVVASNKKDYFKKSPLTKIFDRATFLGFRGAQDIVFGNPPSSAENPQDWDLVAGVRTIHSVLYWDLELAYWMGFKKIMQLVWIFPLMLHLTQRGKKRWVMMC
ncbi:hypothetical protein N9H39_03270 [Gammaproteobacteria bacterium]|nr:hypothetical protein [Gammaproteobacteria bacterium]